MIHIGRLNTLNVLRLSAHGLFVDAGPFGPLLIPSDELRQSYKEGDSLPIFLTRDREGQVVGTTEHPLIQVGEVAFLEVIAVTDFGAFLNWGLNPDLFSPRREQLHLMREGDRVLVFAFVHEDSGRIQASSKLKRHLNLTPTDLRPGQAVSITIAEPADLGFRVVIGHYAWGMLYNDAIHQPLRVGQQLNAFVQRIREDGRIDLCLQRPGYSKVTDARGAILAALEANGGTLNLTDKSDPKAISATFGVSKKTFKKALGALYRERRVVLTSSSISLKK